MAAEHTKLFKVERPKLVLNLQKAANEGDRSENAEYIYTKKRLREIDRRIRYLEKLLKDCITVDPTSTAKARRAGFASQLTIKDENGVQQKWILVGEGEHDFYEEGISWKSPMGKALFGRQLGDKITANTPSGKKVFTIVSLNNWSLES